MADLEALLAGATGAAILGPDDLLVINVGRANLAEIDQLREALADRLGERFLILGGEIEMVVTKKKSPDA